MTHRSSPRRRGHENHRSRGDDNPTESSTSRFSTGVSNSQTFSGSPTRQLDHQDTLRGRLPEAWKCPDTSEDLHQNEPLHLQRKTRHRTNLPQLVVADKNIPMDVLRQMSLAKDSSGGFPGPRPFGIQHQGNRNVDNAEKDGKSRSVTLGDTDLALTPMDAYYFEISILARGTVCIGLAPSSSPHVKMSPRLGTFPGALPNSIGLSSDGALYVSGVPRQSWTEPFRSGDTVGCGIETGNYEEETHRVFFTKNGKLLFPPSYFRELKIAGVEMVPAVGMMSDQGEVKGNFGQELDFRWRGSHGIQYISPDEPIASPSVARRPVANGDLEAPLLFDNDQNDDMERRKFLDTSLSWESPDPDQLSKGTRGGSGGLKFENLAVGPAGALVETQEEEDLRTAMKRSTPKKNLYLQTLSIDPNIVEDAKGFARELRRCCTKNNADTSLLQNLLEVCQSQQKRIVAKLEESMKFPDVNLEELLAINEMMLDAISLAQGKIDSSSTRENGPLSGARHVEKKPRAKASFEVDAVDALVRKKDVFSLICMLRSLNDKRLDSALALMRFVRLAEIDGGADARELRDEIISSGGMHSLLNVYRTKGASSELQVVAAIAIAYLLPSIVRSSSLRSSSITLKIIACLRFLMLTDVSVSPRGEEITSMEMSSAAVAGSMTLWNYALFPLIAQDGVGAVDGADTIVDSSVLQNGSTWRRRPQLQFGTTAAYLSDGHSASRETGALLEATVSLVVCAARLSPKSKESMLHYTLIEQMCAVDIARPIAVREGLLKLLVGWLMSGEKDQIRCAATSIRHFAATHDKYMAGWIHSQIVNEGALTHIASLAVSDHLGHEVRLAVAEILSSLCVAPQTRASVVEANCVNYLIALLLLGHSDPLSQQIAFTAGNSLLQLLSGAMDHASLYITDGGDSSTHNGDSVISDIVEGGALHPYVAMVTSDDEKLRAMAIEAILVLSEDSHPSRNTRLRLCNVGAGKALGTLLQRSVRALSEEMNVRDAYQALYCLSNILDVNPWDIERDVRSGLEDPRAILEKCCVQVANSGGLESLLSLMGIPMKLPVTLDDGERPPLETVDLIVEACHSLALLSQLLLSDTVAASGYSAWAPHVLSALTTILKESVKGPSITGIAMVLSLDVLRGMGALAFCEPLKMRIIDASLATLMETRLHHEDQSELSDAASQVISAMGFTEDEVAVQVAGNDAKLLVDWFCLNRSLLIQAMVREEVRKTLDVIWSLPLSEARSKGIVGTLSEQEIDRPRSTREGSIVCGGLFEFLADDRDSAHKRSSVLQQYFNVYEQDEVNRSISEFTDNSATIHTADAAGSLLTEHVFPLNDADSEKDWILSHRKYLEVLNTPCASASIVVESTVTRFRRVLDQYLPSRALQNDILPILNLRPDASFDFRAMAMPERRYYSFQREGRLLRELCEKHMATAGTSAIHWTVGFTNCSFAGEFSETLVTALYRCPMIRGLSFTRRHSTDDNRSTGSGLSGEEGSGILANLAGSLPPGVSCLTFDNVLNNRTAESLVAILETVDRLSDGQVLAGDPRKGEIDRATSSETTSRQGAFWFFALRNSQGLEEGTWTSFFRLLGRPPNTKTQIRTPPLASLRVLDLSGNNLNDEQCGFVLRLVHDPYSRCGLEQLDLSRNSIRKGRQVGKVFRSYAEQFRSNQTSGLRMAEKSWKSPLHTLNLSSNDLHVGGLVLEIFDLLKQSALSLISLDLSDNGLGNDGYEVAGVLGGSLVKNTRIRHLDLSGNRFDKEFIDGVFGRLTSSESDLSLGFLTLERNQPPLDETQVELLAEFGARCRRTLLEKYLKEQGHAKHGKDSLLEVDDDESFAIRQCMGSSLGNIEGTTQDLYSKASHGDPCLLSGIKPTPDAGENMITVLFSAPLVFRDEYGRLRPFAKLDFDMERELLWQCLKEASRDIDLSFDNATHYRLQAAVAKRCSCLHYSGHGHQTLLPMENGRGGPHWLKVNVLKDLIVQGGGVPFKFVFVSACYSGLAGQTFASAGVPHVVCCQQESELKDAAALAFTRQFYLALAVGHTVRDSFEQGCNAVRATPNISNPDEEMKKFILLPEDGDHDVPVFDARPISEWPKRSSSRSGKRTYLRRGSVSRSRSNYLGGARSTELTVRNMIQENPSPTPPQCFIGREVDMFHILDAILRNRLVSVVGEPGIGRSSIARALCHYINERRNTLTQIERIYFVRANHGSGGERCHRVIRQLLEKILEDKKLPLLADNLDMDCIFDGIWRHLKRDGALIVFDRIEMLDKADDIQDFVLFLSNLFQETHKNVRVVLTGRETLGIPSIGGVVERPYELGPLNYESTVRLFTTLCPHLHTPCERRGLFATLVKDGEEADLYPRDKVVPTRVRNVFGLLGNGIPANIEKVASAMSNKELGRLGEGS